MLSSDPKKIVCIADKGKDNTKPIPQPMTDNRLRQFVDKAVSKDWVKEGFHSEVERADRNISHDDILHGLSCSDWKVTERRYWEKFKNVRPYTYEILTRDIDENELELVIAPNITNGTLKVVTKY